MHSWRSFESARAESRQNAQEGNQREVGLTQNLNRWFWNRSTGSDGCSDGA